MLREKERYRKYLETIFRSVRDTIITINPDLYVVEMNDRAREWAAQFVPSLAVGKSLEELPPSFAAVLGDVKKVLETKPF